MGEGAVRGSRLGAPSYESEAAHIEFADRVRVTYECPKGHSFSIPFAHDAEVPALWECRCGAEALLHDATRPEAKVTKPARTPWDMLIERRTVGDLEVLLDERLSEVKAMRGQTREGRSRRSA
jgi:hypothetical protein